MTTIFIATQPDELRNLLPWAAHIATSRNEQLTVLLSQRKKGNTRLVDVSTEPVDDDSELVSQARTTVRELQSSMGVELPSENASAKDVHVIQLRQIVGEDWQSEIVGHVQELQPKLVIVPVPTISKDPSAAEDWQTQLLRATDCDVMLMRDDAHGVSQPLKPAVFVTDGADDESAFRYALQLVAFAGGSVTAIYVQPNISADAWSLGRRHLGALVKRLVRSAERESIRQRVIVADSTSAALRTLNAREFDILIMGTRDLQRMRKFFDASPITGAAQSDPIPAVAALKCGDSLSNRLKNKADRALRRVVPQLSREDRVNLVSRVNESSKWDFDFVFLVSLSTLIACLGLAENSVAVVVGAMLVAPLMTPIAGVGLGVAHANAYLTKVAFRTSLRGFATAIFIGLLFGVCVQAVSSLGWLEPLRVARDGMDSSELLFPSEMEGRMRPQFYDLLIAFASGVAAAYAMGRPNLFSALPGVAIAAALVPPIATSGIAFSHGELVKGGGALLLFVTNMVTITLGASLIFRVVGIKSQKEGPNAARWPRYVLLLLVLLSVLITVVIEIYSRHQDLALSSLNAR